jgi:hypothetical protein
MTWSLLYPSLRLCEKTPVTRLILPASDRGSAIGTRPPNPRTHLNFPHRRGLT